MVRFLRVCKVVIEKADSEKILSQDFWPSGVLAVPPDQEAQQTQQQRQQDQAVMPMLLNTWGRRLKFEKVRNPVKLDSPRRLGNLSRSDTGDAGDEETASDLRSKKITAGLEQLKDQTDSVPSAEIPERSFGDTKEIHVVCQAAGSIVTLPVRRLVAVNFLPVKDKTTSELYDIFNRSAESVRLKIKPLDFPLTVMQGLSSEQEIPSEDETRKDGICPPRQEAEETSASTGRLLPITNLQGFRSVLALNI
ncbi:Hypp5381 [Branchiostoma lanceolatum]|uniref:Hypp5381 protein n=1 Tax=Branchiostoma lanceolatum TaxID=7740 RepID=A0A8K0AIG9_BRALA|nr:Hypp5381 [Branchiostoma lanceolatum]